MPKLTEEAKKKLPSVIYFSIGNGTVGYPKFEPFYAWVSSLLGPVFYEKEWLKDQSITVVVEIAKNYLPIFHVSADKEWVLKNCPGLVEKEEGRRFLVEAEPHMGYIEPDGFQELNENTRGKLYYIENGDFVER